MRIELITWKITGITPLIQSHPRGLLEGDPEPEEGEATTYQRKKKPGNASTKEDFAACEKQLYINDDGLAYHPANAFMSCLREACYGRKLGRTDAQQVVVHAVALIDNEFILCDPDTLDSKNPKSFKGKEWQIRLDRGINHNKNTGRGGVGVRCCRPVYKRWGGLLTFEIDDEIFKGEYDGLTDILHGGGHIFGIGVGRTRQKGSQGVRPVYGGMGTGKFSAELKV